MDLNFKIKKLFVMDSEIWSKKYGWDECEGKCLVSLGFFFNAYFSSKFIEKHLLGAHCVRGSPTSKKKRLQKKILLIFIIYHMGFSNS